MRRTNTKVAPHVLPHKHTHLWHTCTYKNWFCPKKNPFPPDGFQAPSWPYFTLFTWGKTSCLWKGQSDQWTSTWPEVIGLHMWHHYFTDTHKIYHQGANNGAKTHFCSSGRRLLKSYHFLPTTKCKLHLEAANAQQWNWNTAIPSRSKIILSLPEAQMK